MKNEIYKKNNLIALAGNPNCGKTTLFNLLTGSRQKVGNYAGVTIETKEGEFEYRDEKFCVVDLPGTYSLFPASLDERAALDFLFEKNPAVVVNVIDSTNFVRSVYFTTQLLDAGFKVVLALNMSDILERRGVKLDVEELAKKLSCEVVETSGDLRSGLDELREAIFRASLASDVPSSCGCVARIEYKKLSEKENSKDEIEKRFAFVNALYNEIILDGKAPRRRRSDKIDNVITNKFLGVPIFLLVMYAVFFITFRFGEIPQHWLELFFSFLANIVNEHWANGGLAKSLVVDGVIAGVGGVLAFLPNVALLFACISLLEDTGYMARIAFIMDGIMQRIGLHGKSFIPLVLGFGCSVPAVMATRTLENRRDRLATMFVIPLMSCGARVPIYTLIIPAFFPVEWRPRVLWLVYVSGVLLALFLVRLLRSSLLKGESAPFVMEMPPYRRPKVKNIFLHMWERSALYLKKAGTVIFLASVIMWLLTTFPMPTSSDWFNKLKTVENISASERLENSIAGSIGKFIEPAIKPIGFDWRIGTAFLGASAAKEVFVTELSIIFSMESGDTESLTDKLAKRYSWPTGISVLIFALVAMPCFATVAVVRREAQSWLFAVFQYISLTVIAYLLSLALFQAASLLH